MPQMEYIYAGCEATSVYAGKAMEAGDILAHQQYYEAWLGGARSLDLVASHLSSTSALEPPVASSSHAAAATDSGGCSESLPPVFQLPELEAAKDDEFAGGDGWIEDDEFPGGDGWMEEDEFSCGWMEDGKVSGGDGWMEWLAKEAGWTSELEERCNPSDSSESSEITGSSPVKDENEILDLFFRCVKFVEEDESEKAAKALAELRRRASPLGDPTERVVSYFALALSAAPSPPEFEAAEVAAAHGALNDASPCLNFAYLTANQAILDGAARAERIHIIDFGIRQGVQWAALLQALATRPQGKPRKIKLTGLSSELNSSSLLATGKRLTEFASLLGLELEFSDDVVDVSGHHHDYVAVNFMFHLSGLPHVGAVTRALKRVGSMKPNVVTLAEHELSWRRRGGGFRNAFDYFLAVFESLESKMGRDCGERERVERVLFGEEIKRVVDLGRSCGGCMRAAEEWRSIMEAEGFKRCEASHYAVSQARILLGDYSNKYSVMEAEGGVSLSWQNRPLVTVSLWTP